MARLRAQLLLRAAHEVWVAEDRDFTRRRASCPPGRRDAKNLVIPPRICSERKTSFSLLPPRRTFWRARAHPVSSDAVHAAPRRYASLATWALARDTERRRVLGELHAVDGLVHVMSLASAHCVKEVAATALWLLACDAHTAHSS